MQANWFGRAAVVLGIAAVLGVAVMVHGIWRAGQQLGQLSVLSAVDTGASDQASPVDAPSDEQAETGIDAQAPAVLAAREPALLSDAIRDRFEAESRAARSWNETPDDRVALERLLNDSDPDVRDEATALLQVLDAELMLSAGSD